MTTERRRAWVLAAVVVVTAWLLDIVRLSMDGISVENAAVQAAAMTVGFAAASCFAGACVEWVCGKLYIRLYSTWVYLLLGWRGYELWKAIGR